MCKCVQNWFFLHLNDLFNASQLLFKVLFKVIFSTKFNTLDLMLQRVHLLDVQSHLRISAQELNAKCIRLLIFVWLFCQLQQSNLDSLSVFRKCTSFLTSPLQHFTNRRYWAKRLVFLMRFFNHIYFFPLLFFFSMLHFFLCFTINYSIQQIFTASWVSVG